MKIFSVAAVGQKAEHHELASTETSFGINCDCYVEAIPMGFSLFRCVFGWVLGWFQSVRYQGMGLGSGVFFFLALDMFLWVIVGDGLNC